jgi:hypothetical protein
MEMATISTYLVSDGEKVVDVIVKQDWTSEDVANYEREHGVELECRHVAEGEMLTR